MNGLIKYLVRKLIIIDNEGKETFFPLVIITAERKDDVLIGLSMSPFVNETAGTVYLSELHLNQVSPFSFRIKLIRL